MDSLLGIADIEDCDVGVSTGVSNGLGPRGPNHNTVSSDDGMILRRMLINRDDLGVSEQRSGPGIGLQQIAAHDQRRTEDGPEGQQGPLLVMTQSSLPRLAPAGGRSQTADWQHVCIGPMTGLCDTGPLGGAR